MKLNVGAWIGAPLGIAVAVAIPYMMTGGEWGLEETRLASKLSFFGLVIGAVLGSMIVGAIRGPDKKEEPPK